jgi:transposase
MIKDRQYIGIDISKEIFAVSFSSVDHKQFENGSKGFKQLRKHLPENPHVVMEQTGPYHLKLALFLVEEGVTVSVVNALTIKRFTQMRLKITKTDKADAEMIRQYAKWDKPLEWTPPSDFIIEAKALEQLAQLLVKQSTALKNQKHSIVKTKVSKSALQLIQRHINQIQRDLKKIDQQLEALVKEHMGDLLSVTTSVPGIGKKTAIALIIATNGFQNFESAKQLSSFFGLAPTVRLSGSSIKGKSRISKTGKKEVRNLLFMCSFTAYKHNGACKKLYDRLVAKGKSPKLALIAVANKLLKQVIAIAKSGIPYDPAYKSVNPTLKN